MKNRTNLYYLLGIGLALLMLTGCGVAQMAIGGAQTGASLGGFPSSKKIHPVNACFQPDVDTKKTICKTIGSPSYIVNVGNNGVVLAYNYGRSTYLFALQDNLFKESLSATTKSVECERIKGNLKTELVKIFPCFQKTATYKTPTPK